jgi:hypothetical protein
MNAKRELLGKDDVPAPCMSNLGYVTVVPRPSLRSSSVVIVKTRVHKELADLWNAPDDA